MPINILRGENGGRPKISLEWRLGCDRYLRRRVRSDVAIPRMRAPEEGRSRRLRSREAPIRESGGTFLPTTRPDDLSQHDRRHRLATSPLGQGAPSNRTPASSRPTPGRGVRTILGRRRRLRGLPGRTDGGRPDERPQAHRKAGLNENGLASHLDHRSRPHRNAAATATDAGQPALGRAATTRGPATPDAIPAGQGCDRGAARRSRVLVE